MNTAVAALQHQQAPDLINMAGRVMQLKQMQGQMQDRKMDRQNAAMAAIEEQKATERKEVLASNDFALNLLSGVNSPEDLEIAKSQFTARYPQQGEIVNRLLPSYDPNGVEMIRSSLRTESQRLKLEEQKGGIKGFSAGSALFQGGKPIGQVPFAPQKPPTPKFEVFANKAGEQAYIEKGKPIPPGYTKVMGKGTQITVNTGDLGKTTKAKLEKDIIEGTRNIQSFKETGKLFKPKYLTFFGKGKKATAEAMDKLGLSTKEQKELIKERSKWFRQAKADFIAYRKWATGVAGGEKELKEIATSFPDPVKNSPTQYQANLDSIDETTKRVMALNKDFLQSGIDLPSEAEGAGKASGNMGKVVRYDNKGNRIP